MKRASADNSNDSNDNNNANNNANNTPDKKKRVTWRQKVGEFKKGNSTLQQTLKEIKKYVLKNSNDKLEESRLVRDLWVKYYEEYNKGFFKYCYATEDVRFRAVIADFCEHAKTKKNYVKYCKLYDDDETESENMPDFTVMEQEYLRRAVVLYVASLKKVAVEKESQLLNQVKSRGSFKLGTQNSILQQHFNEKFANTPSGQYYLEAIETTEAADKKPLLELVKNVNIAEFLQYMDEFLTPDNQYAKKSMFGDDIRVYTYFDEKELLKPEAVLGFFAKKLKGSYQEKLECLTYYLVLMHYMKSLAANFLCPIN